MLVVNDGDKFEMFVADFSLTNILKFLPSLSHGKLCINFISHPSDHHLNFISGPAWSKRFPKSDLGTSLRLHFELIFYVHGHALLTSWFPNINFLSIKNINNCFIIYIFNIYS